MNDNKTHADLLESPPMPTPHYDGRNYWNTPDQIQTRDSIWAERVRVALGVGVQPVADLDATDLKDPWTVAARQADNLCPAGLSTPDRWRWKGRYMRGQLSQPAASAVELSDKGWKGLVEKAQFILAKYLPPDGTDEKTTIRELLWLLDGPEYRDVLAKQAAQSPVVGRDAVDAAQLQYLLEKLNNHWGDCTWIDACDIMELGKAIDAAINSKEGEG